MEPEAARALLHEAMAGETCFAVLGWRLPERNLDFPAVAMVRLLAVVCRWPHRAMLAAGGIEGLLAATVLASGSGWRVARRVPARFGAATWLVAEKIQKKD